MAPTAAEAALRAALASLVGAAPGEARVAELVALVTEAAPLLYAGLAPGRWLVVSLRFEGGECVKIHEQETREHDRRHRRRSA